MVLELPQRDAHHIEMTMLPEDLDTLIFQEIHLGLQQGELTKMMLMGKGLRGLLPQVTVRDVPVITTLLQVQNGHMVHWLVIISGIYQLPSTLCFASFHVWPNFSKF